MNWLEELLVQHKENETPLSFWYWGGLATISAVLKDNVFLDRGGSSDYRLYPNIYVMLYADSALRKGPPVSLAKSLVKKVNNTRVISGRSSIQGILKELGTAYSVPGGKVVNKSVGFFAASEFSSSLVDDKRAMDILTDLYDRHYNEGDWKSLLKMETFTLKDPTLTMLVATNEAHFGDYVTSKDVKGGFIGRMFVIYESQFNTLNPLIKKLKYPPDQDKLVPHLKELSKLSGPFKSLEDTKAGQMYEEWYYPFYETAKNVKDETGTIGRFGDSVLKVAMLISLAKHIELEIDEDSMHEALEVCEKFVGSIRKATLGKTGKSEYAAQKTLLIEELLTRENHMISRMQLNKKYWMHCSAAEWDNIAKDLEAAGVMTIESRGNQIIYTMPDNQVKEWSDYLKGKRKS